MPVPVKKSVKKTAESLVALEKLKEAYNEAIVGFGAAYAPKGTLATGIFPFDMAIGGGLPLNQITIFYGPPSSGKTANALKAIAACQRSMKKRAVLVDRENVYDNAWAKRLGVDVDDLIVVKPANAEQVTDACIWMLQAEDVGIVVLDSIASTQPGKWIEAPSGTANVGGNTLAISSLFTKAGVTITERGWNKSPVIFLAINQIRHKIGQMYGNPETMPGGWGPKHWSSLVVRFYGKTVKDEKISKLMPAHLHIEGVVQKWRLPIAANVFEFDMALVKQQVPGGVALPGDVLDSWKTVGHYLQHFDLLAKNGKEWKLFGRSAPTLEQMREIYMIEPEFQMQCQKAVFDRIDKIESV